MFFFQYVDTEQYNIVIIWSNILEYVVEYQKLEFKWVKRLTCWIEITCDFRHGDHNQVYIDIYFLKIQGWSMLHKKVSSIYSLHKLRNLLGESFGLSCAMIKWVFSLLFLFWMPMLQVSINANLCVICHSSFL